MAGRFSALIAAIVLFAISGVAQAVRAQTQSTDAVYAPGWNMVGGPPGTSLSAATALFAYAAGSYVASGTQISSPCQGAWAYFNGTTSVPLSNAAPPAGTQACPLSAGWNMVGNPFVTPAELPSSVAALYWDTGSDRYVTTATIPVGAGVWIYAPSASTVTLQAQPPGTTRTLTITPPFAPQYQAHVGDTIELLLPGPMTYTPHVDTRYLTLIDSGATQSYPETQFWRWRAIAAGETFITLDPACRQVIPPCEIPSFALRLVIQP